MAEVVNPDARSPYQKYGKTPYNYSAMYARAPHLKSPRHTGSGIYAPHVNNPLYRHTREPEPDMAYQEAA